MIPRLSLLPRLAVASLLVLLGSSAEAQSRPVPTLDPAAAQAPVARKRLHVAGLHGDRIEDPYFWMREKDNPFVRRHLEVENAYTEVVMAPFKSFEKSLYEEILGRIQQTDMGVPWRQRGWYLYTRTVEGLQYPILGRKEGSLSSEEEVLLDLNDLARNQPYFSLGEWALSDNNRLLAYTTDVTGFRQYRLTVLDLQTRQTIPTPIGEITDLAWAADHATLFYVVEDAAKRAYRVFRYTLGAPDPVLVHEEPDELFRVGLFRSRDGRILFFGSASSRTTEWYFLRADNAAAAPVLIARRETDHEYFPDHRAGQLYIVTNDRSPDRRIVATPLDRPGRDQWKEWLPPRPGVRVDGIELFSRHGVVAEREGGLPQFTVHDFGLNTRHRITFPEPSYQASVGRNAEYETQNFRFSYQSPVTPASVFDYDLQLRTRELRKQTPVLGGFDPALYQVERLKAKATDGTEVPVTVVRRGDTPLDGTSPLWLNGYGSYGIPYDVGFSFANLSLLERGVIVAVAHVRGGGELGETWHEGGRMMTKRNTFTDFIACAEHLVAEGYTAHDRMVIEGGSAGGLLIGAVLNLRPDLARAAILGVPFVDVLNTMADATLPLTVGEYIEWGNPNIEREYRYMKTYCPYTNLAAQPYPHVLAYTSFNDSQVMYWEPSKWVARLRSLTTGSGVTLLQTNLAAGHGGASGRYDALRERAFELTFGLAALGLAVP